MDMKKLIFLLIISLFFGFKTGDEVDERRMNRDLEIAKNILSTLINTGDHGWFGGTSIEASYIKDYGVVFTIPEHLVYFHSGGQAFTIPDIPPIPDVDVDIDEEFHISEDDLSEEELQVQKEILENKSKEIKEHQKEIKIKIKDLEDKKVLLEEKEIRRFPVSHGYADGIDWEEIIITFMTDYADLIGQLQPNEKIVIKQKSPYRDMVIVWSGKSSGREREVRKGNITAEVLRKDVTAYKTGKIKKEEFVSRIKIDKQEPPKKIADLEMFANIFDRFYSHDLSQTFYCLGKPRYEVLDGYGAIFHIKAASGKYTLVRHDGRTTKSWGEKSENEANYIDFKEDLRAFMLDYGRTIRSLDADENVILSIKLSGCSDCDIPESLEVSTKISLLKQYDQQKISREKALEQIDLKEKF